MIPFSLRVVVGTTTTVGEDVGLLLGDKEPFLWLIEWLLLTNGVSVGVSVVVGGGGVVVVNVGSVVVVVLVDVVMCNEDEGSEDGEDVDEEVLLKLFLLILFEGLFEGCWSFLFHMMIISDLTMW